jgi:hypothetical protein
MGWTVLYVAFGVVALWLLGEVLLQYKARLRWRLLAFVGFTAVVIGVAVLSSVVVITLGAIAFAVGQTFVTLSYRRGFSTGWALGGMPGSSRRRRDAGPPEEEYEDGSAEEGSGHLADHPGAVPPQTYAPQPLPDDTGEYGVYDRGQFPDDGTAHPPQQPGHHAPPAPEPQYASWSDPYAQQPYDGGQQQYGGSPYPGTGYDPDPYAAAASYDPLGDPGYGTQDPAAGYAPQGHDPYAHPQDPYGNAADHSDGYGYPYDPYATGQGQWAPAPPPEGGVWMPQQRDAEPVPEQSYPYPGEDTNGYGYGYDTGAGTHGQHTQGYGYPYDERHGY